MKIRKAEAKDIPVIVKLLHEFAEYENLLEFCEITERGLGDAMFGDGALVEGIIAFDDGTAVGYAIFYPNFSSFRGQRGIYLEDIFIKPEYRGKGIGEAMLAEIARTAKGGGCERIDFLVLEWNKPAIKFYEKLGAVRDAEERHFKFTDEAFQKLSEL